MRSVWSKVKQIAAAGLVLLAATQGVQAAGLMTPTGAGLPELEIRQHHVDVVLQDGYAVTTIEQVFFNPHAQQLEAIYSFPVPERAAVGEFTYWIDSKPVTGEVLEKQHAREVYEQEKAQGRETALTEQDHYRSFDSSVYPVQPDSEVRIRLVYIQPVHVDLGIGRYVYPLEEGGVDEEKLAFWTYNDRVTGSFSFNLRMRSSFPIDGLRIPGYPQASVQQHAAGDWQVALTAGGHTEESEAVSTATPAKDQRLDGDIVVYWRLQQGLPGGVDVVAYRSEDSDRGTFMMTLTPGDDLATITGGRDWIFVLDVSGSMQGKYATLADGVQRALGKLRSDDRFRIINAHVAATIDGRTGAERDADGGWPHLEADFGFGRAKAELSDVFGARAFERSDGDRELPVANVVLDELRVRGGLHGRFERPCFVETLSVSAERDSTLSGGNSDPRDAVSHETFEQETGTGVDLFLRRAPAFEGEDVAKQHQCDDEQNNRGARAHDRLDHQTPKPAMNAASGNKTTTRNRRFWRSASLMISSRWVWGSHGRRVARMMPAMGSGSWLRVIPSRAR